MTTAPYRPSLEAIPRNGEAYLFGEIAIKKLLDKKQQQLATMAPYMQDLLAVRHRDYNLPRTMLDANMPVSDQLYDDPTYNDTFIYGAHVVDESGIAKGGDLDTRNGGEFHTGEQYAEGEYEQHILAAAQALGYVPEHVPAEPRAALDRQLRIADSQLEPVEQPVQAVVVLTAAGLTNPRRIRDAVRNIESGAIGTDRLIIASGERPVPEAERQRLEAKGFHGGMTEFSSAIAALNDVTGANLDERDSQPFSLKHAPEFQAGRVLETQLNIGDKLVTCTLVSAPFDPQRVTRLNTDGVPIMATRASTLDNFAAALEILPDQPGTVVVESHDTWVKSQAEVADQCLAPYGKEVIATGPINMDRLTKQPNGTIVLNKPEEVVDEMAKTYSFIVQTIIGLENQLAKIQ